MEQKYLANIEDEDALYATLKISYDKQNHLFYNMKNILSQVFEEYDIDKRNILSFNVEQSEVQVYVKLEYCKVDLKTLTSSKDKKEQIILTLNHLGLPIEKIRKVEWGKKWPKCDEVDDMTWKVEINEYFDLEECYTKVCYENMLSNALSRFLSTDITVSVY